MSYRPLARNYSAMTSYLRSVYGLKIIRLNFDALSDKYQLVLIDGAVEIDYQGDSTSDFVAALEEQHPELLV